MWNTNLLLWWISSNAMYTADPWTTGLNWAVSLIMMQIFPPNKYSWPSVSTSFISGDSANCRWRTVFSIPDWKSTDAEGWLYALIYTILYKGLEHLQILVSMRRGTQPGTNSSKYWGKTVVNFWGNQNLYMSFQLLGSIDTFTPTVQKSS